MEHLLQLLASMGIPYDLMDGGFVVVKNIDVLRFRDLGPLRSHCEAVMDPGDPSVLYLRPKLAQEPNFTKSPPAP